MATKTQDYTKTMQDMMSAFPMDMSAFQDSFKSYTAFGEKMSQVALEAAEKSTEVSTAWTKGTIAKMSDVSKSKAEPADYQKSISDFASAQAEMTSESMAAFAEIAKKVQMETVEIMMAAGKDAGQEMSAAAKKASDDMTAAAKKATATAK
ncbi:Phasin [Oceaniglobus indicus]|uniref:Phasin n=1 Tax=Oceaniglobus indicus TaxID=2047749 RepID=UPI000C18CB15|nr:Phasin [Oceaniglobus indicus]